MGGRPGEQLGIGTDAGIEHELLDSLQGEDLFAGDQPLVLFARNPGERRPLGGGDHLKDDVGGGDLPRRVGQLVGLGAAGHERRGYPQPTQSHRARPVAGRCAHCAR